MQNYIQRFHDLNLCIMSMSVADCFTQFMDGLKLAIHQHIAHMLLPWHKPRQWKPRWIFSRHKGATLMQDQTMVGIVVIVVVAVLVDVKENLEWLRRGPNRIQ